MHLSPLIEDLALILMAAAVVTLLFRKLKQPVVLGYLMAGLVVGPHFDFFPSVSDRASISVWAEIGVIFMLFGLGLEFSFKKLTKVGRAASITAVFEVLFMLGIGYLTGRLLKWSRMDSLFLGGVLSISSTTIIVRAFDELGLKGRGFVSLVFGVLIVEDLIAILLLVLLSSVAVTQSLSGTQLVLSAMKLLFFLVLWFLLGIYLLPIFLRKFHRLLSDETMLIVSLGLCLLMVIIATDVGFSPALGAFVMGSLLAETSQGHRIERLILPVKDLFSAIFFVSVGMLIDPRVLLQHYPIILLLTGITIVGKFLSTTMGALLSGRNLKQSVQSGMSLAQIGEFSFIIATLGVTLNVTSEFLYPVAVAVSALTTFTTPYLIKSSEPLYKWFSRRLPDSIRESFARYEEVMVTNSHQNIFSLLWKEYGIKIALNSVMVIAIALTVGRWVLPRAGGTVDGTGLVNICMCFATLILSSPFLWAVFLGGPTHADAYHGEIADRLRGLQIGILITRFIVGFILVGFVVSHFESILAFSGVIVMAAAAFLVLFFSRFSEPLYMKIEGRFISNLTEKERIELERKSRMPVLAPWDALLVESRVSPDSEIVGRNLEASGLKDKYGVTVAMIERGQTRILAPQKTELIFPHDKLFLIGTDEQLVSACAVIEIKAEASLPSVPEQFGLMSIFLAPHDEIVGKTIRECGLRESVKGLIVGVEREGNRYLSPDSGMTLNAGDRIWIVGDRSLIKAFR